MVSYLEHMCNNFVNLLFFESNTVYYVIVYAICILLVGIILFFAYMRIKNRFWSIQPVYKWYNISYRFTSPRVINYSLPVINQFVNTVDIRTHIVHDVDNKDRQEISDFIKNTLLRSETVNYLPSVDNIFPYLEYSNQPGYISLYYDNIYRLHDKIEVDNVMKKYIGIVSSRPIYINISGVGQFMIYYMDNLAVADGYKKSEYIPKLIQTHLYNTRKNNLAIHSALFKQNKRPKLIVPLVTFQITCYNIADIARISYPHSSYRIVEMSHIHITLLKEFLSGQKSMYKCQVYPDSSNILNLIKTNNIFIYGTFHEKKLIAIYVFRDTSTTYTSSQIESSSSNAETSANIILCVASATLPSYNRLLYAGFTNAVEKLSAKKIGGYMCVESTSENKKITNILDKGGTPCFREESSFFLYNYITPKLRDNDCLLIY